MLNTLKFLLAPVLILIVFSQCSNEKQKTSQFLIPFTKNAEVNPCLNPGIDRSFICPVRKTEVFWEEKDVFNPASVVKEDTLFLLYRAEDVLGKYNGTSRIALAYSLDGYHFEKYNEPVLYPANDELKKYEWEGGCEDPRVVEDENGIYYMTYTAYDGDKARLFVASSADLRQWNKYGSVFKKAGDKYVDMWSKSGSVLCREENGKMIATKVNGKYWMYWGESNIYMATSDNLIDWYPLLETNPEKMVLDEMRNYTVPFKILFSTRRGKFDSELVEPGPPALLTEHGFLFIYNSKNSPTFGDPNLAQGSYAAGQILTDKNDPTIVLDRLENYFITPNQPYEITGQVNNVCFVEGLARFKNKWFLYYGTADSKIAVAESETILK
ncbi:glycoside hydrolase family 130 protein [Draconibacterium halophilum]|uniref:Glycosidase n=1 Tax=Draconibacterium halophilum TaxID=2706887 RepID=A0A6C0RHN5_9BACT|nr:glycoside hydrolase family 130 protein [Draconibacterium halophilum]QIA09342.1 glycosidase [Draconibacterium halophilum]